MTDVKDVIEKRKKELLSKLKFSKKHKNKIIYALLAVVLYLGYYIRTLNIDLLKDKWPLALDPHLFFRYAKYVYEHGRFMEIDMMRFFPFGFAEGASGLIEFKLLTHVMVYFHRFLSFFNPSMPLERSLNLYPAIAFVVGGIFFFLLLNELFNKKIALMGVSFLAVNPGYLYRTMAGFTDKEALAMVFFFATVYLFFKAYKSKENFKLMMLYASLSGIATTLMVLTWGGGIFLFLLMGCSIIIETLLERIDEKDVYIYLTWMIIPTILLMLLWPQRYGLNRLLRSETTLAMLLGGAFALTYLIIVLKDYLKIKKKLSKKIPYSFSCLGIVAVLGVIFMSIRSGINYVPNFLKDLYVTLFEPVQTNRWLLTVAENKQPYLIDWINQLGQWYIFLFIAGSIILFYETVKTIKKGKWALTSSYAFFILMLIFTRYSSQSTVFNGETTIAKLAFAGSLLLFIGVVGYGFYKNYQDKELMDKVKKMDKVAVFMFLWFFFMALSARTYIRLLFVFIPVTAAIAGYFVYQTFKYISKLDNESYKIIGYVILIIFVSLIFFNHAKISMAQARHTGPSFTPQWESAMSWVQENTPEDAVFSHWWDYGYWVQHGGNRATIADGGNLYYALNHYLGRYVMTGQNEMQALEFLKARGATHLLMIKDEIGKYPAYSSIGSDVNYDRLSWIPTYYLDKNNIQEKRNETVYLYTGGTMLDDDFVYDNRLFSKNNAGLAGFFVPIAKTEDDSIVFNQPEAVLVQGGQQTIVPVNCLYFMGQEILFDVDGLDACLYIIPEILQDGRTDPLSRMLYISPRVRKGLFANLFLFNKSEHFELVYSDENKGYPLAYYGRHLVGPLKIWEINYPEELDKENIPGHYYNLTLIDPRVRNV